MLSLRYLFEIGPRTSNLLIPYIAKHAKLSDSSRAARAVELKRAADARINATGESKLEGKMMNLVGIRSGKQLADQRWNQYKQIYK